MTRADTPETAEPSDPATGSPRWLAPLAVFVAALAVHAVVQFSMTGFADRDAWFHSRLAQLLGSGDAAWHGGTFPWITESAYADQPADWSLLWHWMLAPFANVLGAFTGLKVFTVLQAALLTTTFFCVLRARSVRAPVAWTLLLVAASPEWLFRIHFGRPTPFVLLTLLLLFHLVLRRRDVAAALVVVGSLLLYHVPAPVVLVAGCAWLGVWARDGRPSWRSAATLAAGGIAGLLLHPGLWDGSTFHVWGLMRGSLEVAAAGDAVQLDNGFVIPLSLPRELGSPGLEGLFRELWQPLVATALAVGVGWTRRRDGAVVAGMLLAVAGLAATWRSGRFFEYWHVLALLGAALAVSGPGARGDRRAHRILVGVVALVLVALSARVLPPLLTAKGDDGSAALRPAMAAVTSRSAPGDIVWHAGWDDFAPLFHFAPELRFVRGMDPWWCIVQDPEGALAHQMIADAAVGGEALHELLVARFGARYVVLWSQSEDGAPGADRRRNLEHRLDAVPWATRIHRDDAASVYELAP